MKLRSIAVTALALAIPFAATPVAFADSHPNLVLFGDSLTANPSIIQAIEEGNSCAQDPENIPRQVARNLGLEARDLSCSGAGVATNGFDFYGSSKQNQPRKTFRSQVDEAANTNILDTQTRVVMITIGFNDTYFFPPATAGILNDYANQAGAALSNGTPLPPTNNVIQGIYNDQKINWDREVDSLIPRIKSAAPNAQIVFTSYPAISDENGNNCIVHLMGVPDFPTPLFWIADGETNVDHWMYDASQRHGTRFIDLRSRTMPNNQCADVANRQVAGLIDTSTIRPYNLPGHPTKAGIANAANIITDELR